MRLMWAVLAGLLFSGCAADPGDDPGGDPTTVPDRPGATVIGEADYQLGLPSLGPVQTSTGLGLEVPANATRLLVEVRITLGSSIGLRTQGVPGCDHQYPDPQVMTEAPLVYECDTQPGSYNLSFAHGGGRIYFHVTVTASPPPTT